MDQLISTILTTEIMLRLTVSPLRQQPRCTESAKINECPSCKRMQISVLPSECKENGFGSLNYPIFIVEKIVIQYEAPLTRSQLIRVAHSK